MNNFYTEEEIKDYKLLNLFNDKLNLKSLGQTPKKYYFDASGYTNINEFVEMELKNRNGKFIDKDSIELTKRGNKVYTATTIFIEPQHYSRMIDDYRFDNVVPLYINFLNDAILVFNLATLKNKPQWKYQTHIWDEGAKQFKDEWRILLPINEAYIYNNNYELIYNPKNDK